ncbi:hypothetical protein IQ288_34590 [Burkholderia sp. R-69980]|nr:hypothetical protein [Burkholderia sp. R-69980]
MDEFPAYIGFLQALAPWAIRKPGVRRGSPDWRPFIGPLTDRSACQTQKIVTSLFDWLRDVGYLQLNPDAATRRSSCHRTTRRCCLKRLARGQFAVDLFERTGLRITEVVQCRMGHVSIEPVLQALRCEFPDVPRFQWLLRVKRGNARWAGCHATKLRYRCRPAGSRLAWHRCRTKTCRCAVGATLRLGRTQGHP